MTSRKRKVVEDRAGAAKERRAPPKRLTAKERARLIREEATPRWSPFLNTCFVATHCYRGPDVVQVVGWTHARLICRPVKLNVKNHLPRDGGGGTAHIDQGQWKDVDKPVHKAGPYDEYYAWGAGSGEMKPHVVLRKQTFFREEDMDRVYTWCEY